LARNLSIAEKNFLESGDVGVGSFVENHHVIIIQDMRRNIKVSGSMYKL